MKKILLPLLLFTMIGANAQSKSPFLQSLKSDVHQSSRTLASEFKKASIYPDSIEKYEYDINSMSFESTRSRVEYRSHDLDGNIVQEIFVQNSSRTKKEYVYLDDKEISTTESNWNPITMQWVPVTKYLSTYSQKGYLIETVEEDYDTVSSNWYTRYKYQYQHEYDGLNRVNLVTFVNQDLHNQTTDTNLRVAFVYSGTDTLPSEAFIYNYDFGWDTSAWATRLEWDLGFDPNLEEIQPSIVDYKEWNGNSWVDGGYDSLVADQGMTTDYFAYNYDTDSMYNVLSYSEHHRYDQYGNETVEASINWKYGIADTSNLNTNTYSYGQAGEILERIELNQYFSLGQTSEYRAKYVYYYGKTGIENPVSSFSKVYPNPLSSSRLLKVETEQELSKIQLRSQTGKMMKEWSVYSEGLDLKGFAPGIYFLQVTSVNHSTQNIKIIIQ